MRRIGRAVPSDDGHSTDPLSPRTVSLAHTFAGLGEFALQHDDAAYARLQAAASVDPSNHAAWMWMAALDGLHDRLDAARANLKAFQRLRPEVKSYADITASQPPRRSMSELSKFMGTRRQTGLRNAGLPDGAGAPDAIAGR